jgi:hypothetical protein
MKSLRAKMLSWTIGSILLLMISMGVFNHFQLKRELFANLEQQREAVMLRAGSVLPIAIANQELQQIANLLDAEMNNPAIATLAVFDSTGDVLSARNRDATGRVDSVKSLPTAFKPDSSLDIVDDQRGDGKVLGRVVMSTSHRHVDEALSALFILLIKKFW